MQPNGAAGAVGIDWPAFKRSFTDPVPAKHEADYRAKAVDAFHGDLAVPVAACHTNRPKS
jgi:glutathione reductase (NADPH)